MNTCQQAQLSVSLCSCIHIQETESGKHDNIVRLHCASAALCLGNHLLVSVPELMCFMLPVLINSYSSGYMLYVLSDCFALVSAEQVYQPLGPSVWYNRWGFSTCLVPLFLSTMASEWMKLSLAKPSLFLFKQLAFLRLKHSSSCDRAFGFKNVILWQLERAGAQAFRSHRWLELDSAQTRMPNSPRWIAIWWGMP